MIKIVITDRFDFAALMQLKANKSFDIQQLEDPVPDADVLASAEGLVIRSRTKITKSLLEKSPKLRFIITATSGFDHIDLTETSGRGITVAYTAEANAQSAAELTWALVLASAKRLPEAQKSIRAGDWARESLIGLELSGKTYGVVGLGRVGKRVARIARAFDMQVLAYDPYIDDEDFSNVGAQRLGLDDLIHLSDVVSLHVPKTIETTPLIRPWHFEALSRNAIFVNTSRGTAVDETALTKALASRQIRSAGLDVFEREPLARDSNLLTLPHIALSPHLGATTEEAFAKASMMAADMTIAFFSGNPVADLLPPKAEWFGRHFGPKS